MTTVQNILASSDIKMDDVVGAVPMTYQVVANGVSYEVIVRQKQTYNWGCIPSGVCDTPEISDDSDGEEEAYLDEMSRRLAEKTG